MISLIFLNPARSVWHIWSCPWITQLYQLKHECFSYWTHFEEKNRELSKHFYCEGCGSEFSKQDELKKHLDQMHSEKSTPLKSANVTVDNIILYKRHIGKVKFDHSWWKWLKFIINECVCSEVWTYQLTWNFIDFNLRGGHTWA